MILFDFRPMYERIYSKTTYSRNHRPKQGLGDDCHVDSPHKNKACLGDVRAHWLLLVWGPRAKVFVVRTGLKVDTTTNQDFQWWAVHALLEQDLRRI